MALEMFLTSVVTLAKVEPTSVVVAAKRQEEPGLQMNTIQFKNLYVLFQLVKR